MPRADTVLNRQRFSSDSHYYTYRPPLVKRYFRFFFERNLVRYAVCRKQCRSRPHHAASIGQSAVGPAARRRPALAVCTCRVKPPILN